MIRVTGIILTAILTSLYFFPFEFTFLPGINTKMVMAGCGVILLAFQLARKGNASIERDWLVLSLWAGTVSIAGWIAITYNSTPDTAYATYIISMWVWMGAAYTATSCIRKVHGRLSADLIIRYLLAICVAQCVLALMIDTLPGLKRVVDLYVEQGQDFLNKSNVRRLYGIGASLDVAGSRFAAVLVMTAFSAVEFGRTRPRGWIPILLVAFLVIGIAGNMIARTTTVGIVLAIGYWIYASGIYRLSLDNKKLWTWGISLSLLAAGITAYLYMNVPEVERKMRFAFEGFFSLAETGEWEVSSNERLRSMYVFPETLKTWLIGDGYFSNPRYTDPYFIGKEIGGFYMGTDVGYLRFIFYSGLAGLFGICMVIYTASHYCARRIPRYKGMFMFLLLVNYIIWLKVSTDIFLVFALFLMVNKAEEEAYERQIELGE